MSDLRCECPAETISMGGMEANLWHSLGTIQCEHRATQEDGLCDWCRSNHV